MEFNNVDLNCCRALLLHLWNGILEGLMGLCVISVAILSRVHNKTLRLCAIEKNKRRGRRWNALERFGTTMALCMLTLSIILILRVVTMRLDNPYADHETDETDGNYLILKSLAMKLTNEIERLSNPSSCENTSTLYCGFPTGCGLGCQLHHRATCLILSYSMGIPLIHDTTAWPYGKWEDTFQPLGSHCPTNERTITLKWFDKEPVISLNESIGKEFHDYFQSGIQVDPDLLRAIQSSHPNPSLWFVGQFLKYTMRLSSKLSPVVNDFLSELPRTTPLVGIHIRRTDKLAEIEGSYHEIQDYIIPADAYFRNVNCSVNCTVYLASDDHTMLSQAQKLYPLPQWRFIGLNMSETLHNEKLRYNARALMSIIKDMMALSKCDFVVCGFSSNICRLTLELMNADHPDRFQRVKSLDLPYNFTLLIYHPVPVRLVPRLQQHQ